MICAICAMAGDSLARKIATSVDKRPTERDLEVAKEQHAKCVGVGCACQHKPEQYYNPSTAG